MDALRWMVPGGRIDLNNNQPDPVGHAWLRNVREIRDVFVDTYMPREENGRRRLDWPLAGMTVCAVTAFCVCMYDTYQLLSLSLHDDITTDADSKAIIQEARSRLFRGTACSLIAVLTTKAVGQMMLRREP